MIVLCVTSEEIISSEFSPDTGSGYLTIRSESGQLAQANLTNGDKEGILPLIKNAIPSLSTFGQCPLNTLISGRLSLSHDAPVAAAGPPARLPLLTHTSINYLPRLPSGIKDLSVPPHAPDTW